MSLFTQWKRYNRRKVGRTHIPEIQLAVNGGKRWKESEKPQEAEISFENCVRWMGITERYDICFSVARSFMKFIPIWSNKQTSGKERIDIKSYFLRKMFSLHLLRLWIWQILGHLMTRLTLLGCSPQLNSQTTPNRNLTPITLRKHKFTSGRKQQKEIQQKPIDVNSATG